MTGMWPTQILRMLRKLCEKRMTSLKKRISTRSARIYCLWQRKKQVSVVNGDRPRW
ncbi:hypothetical protein LINGRAPRIM_LOCUS2513 [Linum grandiflorum]